MRAPGLPGARIALSTRCPGTAGLLDARREGYYVVYSLNTAQIRSLPQVLEQFLGDSPESRAA